MITRSDIHDVFSREAKKRGYQNYGKWTFARELEELHVFVRLQPSNFSPGVNVDFGAVEAKTFNKQRKGSNWGSRFGLTIELNPLWPEFTNLAYDLDKLTIKQVEKLAEWSFDHIDAHWNDERMIAERMCDLERTPAMWGGAPSIEVYEWAKKRIARTD